jgi:thiamine biosynthesis lipoprotein
MRRVEEQWGTRISFDARDVVDAAVVDQVFEWFARVDDLFSTWRDDTEIMRISRGELDVDDASKEVRVVLALFEPLRVEATARSTSPSANGRWDRRDPVKRHSTLLAS